MHKVHHSRWQLETDSNYSSLLSIWDCVFRSFRFRDDPPPSNLVWMNLQKPEDQTLPEILKTTLADDARHRLEQGSPTGAPPCAL